MTDETRQFLRNSQCGYYSEPKPRAERTLVCCPEKYRKIERSNNGGRNTTPANELPEPGKCGRYLSNRIYGGNVTEIDEFPWMALIQYKKAPKDYVFFCGGSLINSHYILTAAHCIANPKIPIEWQLFAARLGEWDLREDPDCIEDIRGRRSCIAPHIDIRIDYAIVHPLYRPTSPSQLNDIALVRLRQSVPNVMHIIPICLPISEELRTKLYTSYETEVAGWGVTENGTISSVKLRIRPKVQNIEVCEINYRLFGITISPESQLCVGGEADIDVCSGDSGGPLMVIENTDGANVYIVAGIVSYGPAPCGFEGWPSVHTKVGSYMDWIIGNLLP
ncbi:serine protease easter-like [Musca vetustissima]|uniref:serine protease easter-like n=1 Tax=Musca vetustissima TaxID=27455 RepID=UPI002AB79592|nr:serine protease easter-like [Musca vetustissima]